MCYVLFGQVDGVEECCEGERARERENTLIIMKYDIVTMKTTTKRINYQNPSPPPPPPPPDT